MTSRSDDTNLRKYQKLGARIFESKAQIEMQTERDFAGIQSIQKSLSFCRRLNNEWAVPYLTLSRAELNFGDASAAMFSSMHTLSLFLSQTLAQTQKITPKFKKKKKSETKSFFLHVTFLQTEK